MARTITGVVSSATNDKTIVVTAQERRSHALYDKQYTVTNKYSAHDETNDAKVGDTVEIAEARPYSKTKTWKLVTILQRAVGQ